MHNFSQIEYARGHPRVISYIGKIDAISLTNARHAHMSKQERRNQVSTMALCASTDDD